MRAPLLKVTGKLSNMWEHAQHRNLAIFAPAMQKDPIQQLFLDKIREFKNKASGGKLVEPSPELTKELESERSRVYRQYNVKPGEDLTKFPQFNFPEPKLEPPILGQK